MMKMNKKQTDRNQALYRVFRECAHIMIFPLVLNIFTQILSGTLGIVVADIVGNFADAAFELNLSVGLKNVGVLVGCIVIIVVVIPAFGLFSDLVMLKEALLHDNMIFGHFLDKDYEKVMKFDRGEIQFQLEDAPNELRIYLVNVVGKVFALPFCLGYLLYCAGKISWLLTFLMFGLTAIKLVVPLFFKEKLAEYDKKDKLFYAKRRDYEADILVNSHIVKLWGINNTILDRGNNLFKTYYQESKSDYIVCEVFSEQLREFMRHFTLVLIFLFGTVLVAWEHITPGDFTSMLVYFTVTQTFLNDIGEIIQKYPLMVNAANRVCEFYTEQETTGGKSIIHFTNLNGKNMSFAYDNKVLFQNLDFSIAVKDKVVIRGKNGCGKSTLIKIICLLLKSYSGVIQVDNENLKNLNVKEWRQLIAYAPQAPYLFSTTIRENVTMGNLSIEREDVDRIMKDFGILSIAERVISADTQLSGGEKQKISIIRALIKESELLILDEPSNHLDAESITVLKQYIAASKKTVMLITHDDSLLNVVNRTILF